MAANFFETYAESELCGFGLSAVGRLLDSGERQRTRGQAAVDWNRRISMREKFGVLGRGRCEVTGVLAGQRDSEERKTKVRARFGNLLVRCLCGGPVRSSQVRRGRGLLNSA